MKKRTLKTIACAAVMALALSVTACGGSDDDAKTSEETSAVVEDAESEAEVETEDTVGDDSTEVEAESEAVDSVDSLESYSTLEDYYNDPAIKSVLDDSFANMVQSGMSLSIETSGNVLTMICKIEDSSLLTDEVKDGLSAALDANAATFGVVAASFDEAIGQDAGTCTFVVRYTDPDDNVLAEQEFKAQ